MAPRPNDGARLATVGPCQVFAWLHTGTIPSILIHFCVNNAASLLIADAVIIPVVAQRLTVFHLNLFQQSWHLGHLSLNEQYV